jgi:hypothetical protein
MKIATKEVDETMGGAIADPGAQRDDIVTETGPAIHTGGVTDH